MFSRCLASLTRAPSIGAPLIGTLLFGVAGCDANMATGSDGSTMRDAVVVDGGGLLDAGPRRDAGVLIDAGASGDAQALCLTTLCDPRSPDGCDEGRCVLNAVEASCSLEAGSLGPGDACTSVADCAPGLACFRRDGGGVCGRICCPRDHSTCTEGMSCGGAGVLVDGSETNWGRCMAPRPCDLLEPTEYCELREGCYIVDSSGRTECRVAGSGGPREPCQVQEDCQSGFFCGGIGGAKRCVRICRIGERDCPAEEGRCVAQWHTSEGSGLCTLDAAG